MSRLSDLVRDSKLDTRFQEGDTIHIYYEPGQVYRHAAPIEKRWRREKCIGRGSFGRLWLEKCVDRGRQRPELRAVKEIPIIQQGPNTIDYNRELEAMAKFSHQKVRSSILSGLVEQILMPNSMNGASSSLLGGTKHLELSTLQWSTWNTVTYTVIYPKPRHCRSKRPTR